MKLQNNSKSTIKTSAGLFKIKAIMEFEEKEGRMLLRYKGIDSYEALLAKSDVEDKIKSAGTKAKAKA